MNYTLTATPVFALANLDCLKLKKAKLSFIRVRALKEMNKLVKSFLAKLCILKLDEFFLLRHQEALRWGATILARKRNKKQEKVEKQLSKWRKFFILLCFR